MLLVVVAALGAESEHRFAQGHVLLTADVGGQTVELALPPCDSEACPLVVRTGETSHTVRTFSGTAGRFTVSTLDSGAQLVSIPRDSFSVEWKVLDRLPVPALLVHAVVGYEHVADLRKLYTIGERGLVEAWSGSVVPRSIGRPGVEWIEIAGEPTLVEQFGLRLAPDTQEYDRHELGAWQYDASSARLVPVDDVPLYAVVSGTYPTAAEALAARVGCAKDRLLLKTDDFPRLTPGLFALVWLTPYRRRAESALDEARKCVPDAYLKRGR